MNVSIVLLNWNGAEDTIACLRPMLDWRQVRPFLIVVDNASQGDDVAQIRQALPGVQVIENATNEGFSGGSNRGMEAALAQSDAPILLLNNDAMIAETAVLRLIQTLQENPQIGLVVPQLFDEHGKLVAIGGKNPAFHLQTRVKTFPNDDPVQIVETVSGTAVLIHPTMLRQVGLLDERFFFSTEMADLTLRARQHGFVCAVDRRAEASHTISRSAPLRSSLYVYYVVRNRLLFLGKNYRSRLGLRTLWFLYTVLLALKLWLSGERVTARAVWLALRDGVNGRFGGQNERVQAYCQSGAAT
jgi:GT2 family glycosyltransferase